MRARFPAASTSATERGASRCSRSTLSRQSCGRRLRSQRLRVGWVVLGVGHRDWPAARLHDLHRRVAITHGRGASRRPLGVGPRLRPEVGQRVTLARTPATFPS
jgi:hypothetical protein